VVIKYNLGDGDVDINKLAKFITQVITGKDKDRNTQKKIRENIVYALESGALRKVKRNHVGAIEFFTWASKYKLWQKHWPAIKRVKGLPSIDTVIHPNTASKTLATKIADINFMPGDRDEIVELLHAAKYEITQLRTEVEELKNKLTSCEAELELLRQKELHHKESSAKGGEHSRGQKKYY